ncbi:amidohydrolase [Microbacterium enclense]|uniref:Amidohydrolase 3 domain-containing protein n=1 Tax=Microbacterium enclense TaxID=993073 RepID=A0A1G6GWY3_9MICO|nr:amidohydrolase [Microbacterium enclense]KSU56025.1 amidohydrolase [Microbacterium enclense]SDB86537.1 hypothetical protein SAMN05216418_0788 [Microbacterium enclense]
MSGAGPTFFHGGVVRTGAGDTDRLLVVDGVVRPAPQTAPAGAEIVDLRGGYLGPAFADGHAHPLLAGMEAAGPTLRHLGSVAQIARAVERWADEHPDATWITGASYDATIAADGLFDARWLDHTARPVVLRAWDYHTVWCNSAALRLAGIDRHTPDPPLGHIVRRPDGEPLGTLREAAVSLVWNLVPQPGPEERAARLGEASRTLAAYGITWAQEAWAEPDDLDAWAHAAERDLLAIDVDLALRADPLRWPGHLEELVAGAARIEGLPGLTARTLKFFVDGIVENRTASLLDDYADTCTRGLPNWRDGDLAAALVDAQRAGFDIHLHAIGDAGVRTALDAVAHLRSVEQSRPARVTIAHAQLIHPDDLQRFAALDVTVCFQPLWAQYDAVMRDLTLPAVGVNRATQYRMASVLASGARLTFGSDWPVTSPDVLAGIATAVTRQTPDGMPEGGWSPEERLTITDALDAASRAATAQGRRGTPDAALAPGAAADLVWLSDDPRTTPPTQLRDIQVLGTWRRGRRIHASAEARSAKEQR